MAKRIGIFLKMQLNTLARGFYMQMGYRVEQGYDFSKAIHPTERMVGQMALLSFDFWNDSKESP